MEAGPQTHVTIEVPILKLRSRAPALTTGVEVEVLRAETWAAPGGHGGPLHVHPEQEERFVMVSGRIDVRLGRRWLTLGPGEELAAPPGTPHRFENTGDVEAHFFTEFRPALRVQEFFANLFGLANDGRTNDKGLPTPLQAALLMHEFPDEFLYAPYVPIPVQRAIAAPLAALGRRRGLRGSYPEYVALLQP